MSVLESNNLTRPNFLDWLRNTKIILASKKILYILDEAALELPLSDALTPNIKKDVAKRKCFSKASVPLGGAYTRHATLAGSSLT